jgi:GTP cyclohydrolase II
MTPTKPRLASIPAAAHTQADISSAALPDLEALRLRAVHRAAADLRRGVPVLLQAEERCVLLAAEAAGTRGLAELALLAPEDPLLVLAPTRAAALMRRAVEQGATAIAFRVPATLINPEALRGLADPTAEQAPSALLEPVPNLPAAAPAALALAKLARLLPAVLVAPARLGVDTFATQLNVLSVRAADILRYPGVMATALTRVAEVPVPLEDAPDARVVAFREPDAGTEHLAIVIGRPETHEAPLVRVHSECFTGDLLGSLRCDCGPQLRGAIRRMAEEGAGALLYLAQEGRGIGLVNKLRAYSLQDRGLDTLDANRALGWDVDERNFLVAATMLEKLGIARVRLLTNNPAKVTALAACGVEVVGRERHVIEPNGVNDQYLATKAERFGHLLK